MVIQPKKDGKAGLLLNNCSLLPVLTPRLLHRHPGRPELDRLVEVDERGDGDAGVDAGVARRHVVHGERVAPDAGGAVLHVVLRDA